MPREFIKSSLIVLLILGMPSLMGGCAAPGGEPLSNPDPIGNPIPKPNSDPNVFSVVIHTTYDLLYIDDLESEFNQRRGIRSLWGFDESEFSTLIEVPWGTLQRVDFEGIVDPSIWEQIHSGREDQGIDQDQVFRVLLQYKSGTTRYFYAVISKFRGYKDGVKWTMGMTGNQSVDYIEFPH